MVAVTFNHFPDSRCLPCCTVVCQLPVMNFSSVNSMLKSTNLRQTRTTTLSTRDNCEISSEITQSRDQVWCRQLCRRWMTRLLLLTLTAAADAEVDDDAAMDRYARQACTEHQVLHTMTEASHVAVPRCCLDREPTAL